MQPMTTVARRLAIDFVAGLALISAILFAMVETSTAGSTATAAAVTSPWLPYILIAGMFSLVMAFNLALYRHVRRVYIADPGRRGRSAAKRAS